MTRPLALVDLDDTLFQTARRMADGPRHVATLDIHGAPMSYMSPVQKTFVDWLLASTDLVPVTARSVEAYQRVQIPFPGPAVCTHGGVILDGHGVPDPAWQAHMVQTLAGYQARLFGFVDTLLRAAEPLGLSLRTWAVVEDDLAMYVVAKQNGGDHAGLTALAAALPQYQSLDGCYLHLNNNNLAILPTPLTKRRAVDEILRRDREEMGERPVIGLGDSLSDLGFLDACHWWGTPRKGQVADLMTATLEASRPAAEVPA